MKIVITGVPRVGKTTMAKVLAREFATQLVVRRDSLDGLQNVLQPKPISTYGKKCALRAAYHLTVELENILDDTCPQLAIFCDRGTLDILNIWPDAKESFFSDVDSDLETELRRYDWVLDVGGANPSAKNYWKLHPHYLSVPSSGGFSVCTMALAGAVQGILDGRSHEDVRKRLMLRTAETAIDI